jgi:hypothetical protein
MLSPNDELHQMHPQMVASPDRPLSFTRQEIRRACTLRFVLNSLPAIHSNSAPAEKAGCVVSVSVRARLSFLCNHGVSFSYSLLFCVTGYNGVIEGEEFFFG